MANDPDTFIPWGMHPIKPWVIKELQDRSNDYGLDTGGSGKRNGVKTTWARFFSNGIPTKIEGNLKVNDTSKNLDGFLMFGVNGFDDSFGFNQTKSSTIGLDANGKPHVISNETTTTFPHRPPPSIDDITVELQGGQSAPFSAACKKSTIKWKAYSLDQLNYLAPYFLSPRVTCVIEWGWDNYNPASLIDYSVEKLRPLFGNPKAILEKSKMSNGNYDAHTGIITDYAYKLSGNGVYECSTTVTSVAWLFEGQNYGSETLQRKTKDGKFEKIESFSEFNKYSKWDSLGLYSIDPAKFSTSFPADFPNPRGRVFRFEQGTFFPTIKQWVRMDYFVEILNHFFTTNFPAVVLDKNNKETQFQWQKIQIDNVLIGAHPGLKSIDPDIIIPNKFSPKYIRSDTTGKVGSTGNLSAIENGEHYKKYGRIQSILTEFQFTDQYDDLEALLNKYVDPSLKGKSFPIFSDSDVTDASARNFYKQSIGYFGYLKDIYISTEFIKSATKENGTVRSMMTSILSKISYALSGVNELRLMPDTNNNENYVTVMDIKFAPVLNEKTASELTRIVPGSVNHAYLLSAGMDVKMSPEMASQVLFTAGSAELAEREKQNKAPNDTENKDDNKTKPTENAESFGKFVSNDRLADKAYKSPSTTSNTDSKNEKAKLSRNTADEGFNIYSFGDVDFYLNEPSDTLMKQIVMEDRNAAAAYVNAPVMPNTIFEFETLGIAGFTFLGMYTLDHVPEQYSYKNAIFSIKSVKQNISFGMWKTTIGAELRQISRKPQ
jgi:hypothetical protein